MDPASTTAAPPVVAWHAASAREAGSQLGVGLGGLDGAEAERRLRAVGSNVIHARRGEPAVRVLVRQLSSPLIVVLLVAGVVAIALGDYVDGVVVLAVVAVNTAIGFLQEWRAARSIEALDAMLADDAAVVRDGRLQHVAAADVVPGDLLTLAAGDRVAADARIVAARLLEVDESPLTGESLPVAKQEAAVDTAAPLGDRSSIVHGGTLVAAGTATAVVVATGRRTELGRIADLLAQTRPLETPLTRSLAGFSRALSGAICAIAVLLAVVGLVRGYEPMDAALAAIALAVAAIPEGLPAIVTIALAIGVQRMARRRAVIRRLPAVETLGSTTVICTDKTGTLTHNRMRVEALWTPAGGESRAADATSPAVAELFRAGVLCSDADGGVADPTEAALVAAAERAGIDARGARAAARRLDALPFDGARRLMLTVHRDGPGAIAYLKGAPEAVLAHCASDPELRRRTDAAVGALAGRGMRVLAFARRRTATAPPTAEAALAGGWDLLGLQAMVDPPREDAIDAVAACRAAGIDVKMITGDHLVTARAIGARFGLHGRGLTGDALDALDRDGFGAAARETHVFARVAPEHKLRLVEQLQRDGEVVAMTGDGVNDAPALRQADIGVAMGQGGTATAREAADVVLADDDFATIAAAVEEGRRVYDNVRKAVAFTLPTNLGEALVILVAVLVFPFSGGEPLLPVSPTQILWVNLIATVTLALPLAVEAMEPALMRRRPRRPGTALLDRTLLVRTVAAAGLMTVVALGVFVLERRAELATGVAPDTALAVGQTAAVTAIVLFQVVYLLECRSLRTSLFRLPPGGNPWVWAGIAAVLALQSAFIYAPPLQQAFGSAALDGSAWALAAAGALLVLPAVEAEKAVRSARGRRARDAGR